MTKKKPKKKYMKYRHTFYFQTSGINGKKYKHPISVRVVAARVPVTLRLTAEDVSRSIKLGGRGNTQTCSMAVCALRQAPEFDHDVEGFIDWSGTRAYVVSKVNAKTGFPEECVVYRHHDDIADLNDTDGGQRRLLEDLNTNGDRDIKLYPITDRSSGPSGGSRKSLRKADTKPRKERVLFLKGASRRVAIAQLGFVP